MTRFVSLDFETRSLVDLKATGVYVYAAHPSTEILCACFATDDQPDPQLVWRFDETIPPSLNGIADDVQWYLDEGYYFRAWNANFERIIYREICHQRFGWPAIPDDRWVCTMAIAGCAALPLSLESAAIALGLPVQKDAEGRRLMLQMTKPRKPRKGEDPSRIYWHDDAERMARLVEYCKQDNRTEIAVWRALPAAMDPRERAIWLLDQRINDRGVLLDRPFVEAAREFSELMKAGYDRELAERTGGMVTAVTQTNPLRAWLATRGVHTASVAKEVVETLLTRSNVPEDVRDVLSIRQLAAKSSTAKLDTMLAQMGADDRARGQYQYGGTGTTRWAGRGIQVQNLPKGEKVKPTASTIEAIRHATTRGWPPRWLHGSPLDAISACLRGCFVAAPGKTFHVADFNAIEARVIAWLAGQQDLLDRFAAKEEIYCGFTELVLGLPPGSIVKKDPRRNSIGKVGILGCGFGMGAGKMAMQYDLPRDLAEQIVKTYRATYSRIPALWRNMDVTTIDVVRQGLTAWIDVPGTGGKLAFRIDGAFLAMRLPSGRSLWYHRPRLVDRLAPWGDYVQAVEIDAMNSMTRQWEGCEMYGGVWAENATQAVARDLLADAMVRLDRLGWDVVMHSHDEVIAEVPKDVGDFYLGDYVTTLEQSPNWAFGLPIAAEGWKGERYRK